MSKVALKDLLHQKWVVLFGGGDREQIVHNLAKHKLQISVVIVPKQRSKKLEDSIKTFERAGLRIITVDRRGLGNVLESLSNQPILSIGFPFLIPSSLLDRHPIALNVHPTRLPAYRGPTSGAHILINNEPVSGSTVHLMDDGMDTGDVICQSRVPISKFDTIMSLMRKVYAAEPALVLDAIHRLDRGAIPWKQPEGEASEYPKRRTPEDSCIDPTKSLLELFDEIRACDPDQYPAYFYVQGQKVCVRLWRPDKSENEIDTI